MHKGAPPRPPAERAGAGTSDHQSPSPPPRQYGGWPAVTQPKHKFVHSGSGLVNGKYKKFHTPHHHIMTT